LELGLSQESIPTGEQSGLLTHIVTNGKRFVVQADEKLTAFMELESQLVIKGMMSRKRRISRP
jgi:hypothetical protein